MALAPTPVTVRFTEREALPLPPMVGMYLKRRHGADLLTIGQLVGQDATSCQETREPTAPDSVEGLLTALRTPSLVLDLR